MDNITVILVEPQMGENIGAAARAMLNFGITDLRLVNPRDGWPNDDATATATGALEHISISVFDTLAEAIADIHVCFATTARPRNMIKPVYELDEAATIARKTHAGGQNIALIFGGERSGLDNDDIALTQGIITLPTNPEFSSLNLAQAVLLVVYGFANAISETKIEKNENTPAPQKDLEAFLVRLENSLEEHDFFKSPDLAPTMKRSVRNIFTRHDLTEQEVRTLQGILSAFTKH